MIQNVQFMPDWKYLETIKGIYEVLMNSERMCSCLYIGHEVSHGLVHLSNGF